MRSKMKSKIALLMATVMAMGSLSVLTMAASANTVSEIKKDMKPNEILVSDVDNNSIDIIDSNIESIASGSAVSLQIRPTSRVDDGESIILTVKNGKFDERLVNADPFIFRTEVTGTTYDTIVSDERSYEEVMTQYIGGEGSRKLPYSFKYWNDEQIEVLLYPLPYEYTNTNNTDVTEGVPYYDIKLPITSKDSSVGDLNVSVDWNDSSVSEGTYTVAKITENGDYTDPIHVRAACSMSRENYSIGKNEILISNVTDKSMSLLDSQEGIDSLANGTPIELQLRPVKEIKKDSSFTIKVENGVFDEKLVNAKPFKFTTKYTNTEYDEIYSMINSGLSVEDALIMYIGNENSRKLPYKMEYVSENEIKVTLFPIGANYVNTSNDDVTQGIPNYSIGLPIVTKNSEMGNVSISIDALSIGLVIPNITAAVVTDNAGIVPSPSGSNSTNGISISGFEAKKDSVVISNVENTNVSVLDSAEGISSLKNGTPIKLKVQPKNEVLEGESIILIADNCKFDERLVNADPYIFRTAMTLMSYNGIIQDGRDNNTVLNTYIGNENSRRLPYGFRYIDENMLEVYLFPIDDSHVNRNNSDVTQGIPYYDIALPITTAGSATGEAKVGIYTNNSSVSGGTFTVAGVDVEVTGNGGSSSNTISSSIYGVYKNEIIIKNIDELNTDLIKDIQYLDTLKAGTPMSIEIRPQYEVTENQSIILNIENGKFDERLVNIEPYAFRTKVTKLSYDDIMTTYPGLSNNDILSMLIGGEGSRKLPYKVNYINDKQVEVKLFPIDDTHVNKNNSDVTMGTPYYDIALPITSENSVGGNVSVNVIAKGASISDETLVVAKVIDENDGIKGSVVASSVKDSMTDTYAVPDITIKEDVGRIFNNQTIKLTLNNGYTWTKVGTVTVGVNFNSTDVAKDISINGNTLEFTLNGADKFDKGKASSVIISGFEAEAKTNGDINVTITGSANVNTHTLKVGARINSTVSESTTAKVESTSESTTAMVESTSESTTARVESTSESTTARVESTSESTTIIESTSETTTKKTTGGGGGGGSSSKTTTTTTATTTEATTEVTTVEVKAESTSEATTEESKEVRVVIGSKSVNVNGKSYTMEAVPYIQASSNSTLVPLRFVVVALTSGDIAKADESNIISWNSNTKEATVKYNNATIVFTSGSNIAKLNGKEIKMDNGVTAEIKDGRIYVPFRMIGENMGYEVLWESESKTAVYKK